jgi:hypothetical protein
MFFGIAEVVGSNPTRSTFINLVNYGIISNSFLMNVGQIQQLLQEGFRAKLKLVLNK